MKRVLIVLVALSPAFLWFLLPSVSAAGTPITSEIGVSWELSADNGASVLLPSGAPIVMHPDYYDFKMGIVAEVGQQVPTDIRNAWPFHGMLLNEDGHKPEEEVRLELVGALGELNARRAELAQSAGNPIPPDFTLTTHEPEQVYYKINNSTVECVHSYPLSLGGSPWEYADPSIGATAAFRMTLSWESRIY